MFKRLVCRIRGHSWKHYHRKARGINTDVWIDSFKKNPHVLQAFRKCRRCGLREKA